MARKIKYLDRFGTVKYDFTGKSNFGLMTNFTKFIQARDIGEISSYRKFTIQPGDTPDMVSNRLYGTPEYYWTLYLANPRLHSGPKGWPLSDQQMDKYFDKNYHPYSWVSGDINETQLGFVSDIIEDQLPYDAGTNFIGNIPLHKKYLPHLRLTFFDEYSYITQNGNTSSFNYWYPFTDLKIINYDHDRLGLIVTKPELGSIAYRALDFDDNNPSNFQKFAITHDNTSLGLEWRDLCISLGLAGWIQHEESWTGETVTVSIGGCLSDGGNGSTIFGAADRGSFTFQSNRLFTNYEFKNAIYQFYVDEIDLDGYANNGVIIPFRQLTHHDVMLYGVDDNIPAIFNYRLESGNKEFEDYNLENNTLRFDQLSRITFAEYEIQDNDEKKSINVIRPDVINVVAQKYYNLIKQ